MCRAISNKNVEVEKWKIYSTWNGNSVSIAWCIHQRVSFLWNVPLSTCHAVNSLEKKQKLYFYKYLNRHLIYLNRRYTFFRRYHLWAGTLRQDVFPSLSPELSWLTTNRSLKYLQKLEARLCYVCWSATTAATTWNNDIVLNAKMYCNSSTSGYET